MGSLPLMRGIVISFCVHFLSWNKVIAGRVTIDVHVSVECPGALPELEKDPVIMNHLRSSCLDQKLQLFPL